MSAAHEACGQALYAGSSFELQFRNLVCIFMPQLSLRFRSCQ